MKNFLPMILLAALLLPACGSVAQPTAPPTSTVAVSAVSPTTAPVEPTAPTAPEPTATIAEVEVEPEMAEPTAEMASETGPAEEMAAPEVVNWLITEGKTADGRTFLGNPDAPVTMIDYSDFM